MKAGAHGVDMGRNVWQSAHPAAKLRAIREIVHKGATAKEAHDFFKAQIKE